MWARATPGERALGDSDSRRELSAIATTGESELRAIATPGEIELWAIATPGESELRSIATPVTPVTHLVLVY